MTDRFSNSELFTYLTIVFLINNTQNSLYFILLLAIMYSYSPRYNLFFPHQVEVGVTSFILSGTILKSLFAVILTSKTVMRKLALKIGDSQKFE